MMDEQLFESECVFAKLVSLSDGFGILIAGRVFRLTGKDGIDEEMNLNFVWALRNSQGRESSSVTSVSTFEAKGNA